MLSQLWSHSFFRLRLGMTATGRCVGRPPLMAGLPVPSTAGVMGKTIRLRSSEKTSTCSEDTLIFLGVSDFFAGGGANKRDGVSKINIKPLKKRNWSGLGSIWQIIKQVTNSRTNQELYWSWNCLARNISKLNAVFYTKSGQLVANNNNNNNKTLTRTVQYLREYSHFSYDHIKALTTDNYSLMSKSFEINIILVDLCIDMVLSVDIWSLYVLVLLSRFC